jgi:hypothetical protein
VWTSLDADGWFFSLCSPLIFPGIQFVVLQGPNGNVGPQPQSFGNLAWIIDIALIGCLEHWYVLPLAMIGGE